MKITVSELRPKLTKVLEMVAKGEVVDIEQRGKIVAQIKPAHTEILTEDVKQGIRNFNQSTQSLEQIKARDKRINDLLRGVNRNSKR